MSRNPATAARRAAWSLGRTTSPCLEDLLERRQVLGVGLEVLPDGGQLPVETRGDTGLQVLRMELSVGVRLRQGLEGLVDDVTPELRIAWDHQPPLAWEQDQSRHLEDGISLRLLRGAEGLADLPVHFVRTVVQQDAGIRPRFRHLARDEVHPSAAVERREERRVQGVDRVPAEHRRHVPVQHVCVSLVHASQREVQVHPMDVRHLHGRVYEHGGVQVGLLLLPAHDRQGPPDPGDRRRFRSLDHVLPVFRMPDELVRVEVLDRIRHTDGAESVLEILRAHPQVLEVAPELVVDVRVPIGQVDDRVESRGDEVRDLRTDHEGGADVHESGRFQPHVRARRSRPAEEGPAVGAFIFLIFVLIFLFATLKVVKEYERIVNFRLGKAQAEKGPGIVVVIPGIDKPVRVDLRERFLTIPHQTCITKDNAPVDVDFIVYFKVASAADSVIRVNNFEGAAMGIATTTLRAVVGDIILDEVLSKREEINAILRTKLDEVTTRWGVKVTNVEIREILPPKNVTDAMILQMSAERSRRAVVIEADGRKTATVTIAEGDKQSAILRSEGARQAAILNAEGYAQALSTIFGAAKGIDEKTLMLQYLDALRALGASPATKFILPLEFTELIRPFRGILASAEGAAKGDGK